MSLVLRYEYNPECSSNQAIALHYKRKIRLVGNLILGYN